MERKKYIELSQKASKMPKTAIGREITDKNVLVRYKNIEYYPVSYTLSFDDNGQPRHTATLHDLRTKTTIDALLEKVE